MNPENNQQNPVPNTSPADKSPQGQAPVPQQPVDPRSATEKMLEDTTKAAAAVGLVAGVSATIKGIFGKRS